MRERDRIVPWTIDDDIESDEPNAPSDACPATDAPIRVARIRCPACECPGEEDLPDGWARCTGCGMQYARVRPSRGQLAAGRDERLRRLLSTPGADLQRASKAQASEIMRGYFAITKGTPAARNAFGLNVLDIGCGAGHRMRVFEDYGWTAFGTETGAAAYEQARRLGLEVRHGWLAEAGFGSVRFDLAFVCGAFGEMPDPNAFAEHIWSLLKTGGLLCLLAEPLAPIAAGDGRLFSFTPEALTRVMRRNRYDCVSDAVADGHGTFWFRAAARRPV
jgi:SAM-dependent methyltransferase